MFELHGTDLNMQPQQTIGCASVRRADSPWTWGRVLRDVWTAGWTSVVDHRLITRSGVTPAGVLLRVAESQETANIHDQRRVQFRSSAATIGRLLTLTAASCHLHVTEKSQTLSDEFEPVPRIRGR